MCVLYVLIVGTRYKDVSVLTTKRFICGYQPAHIVCFVPLHYLCRVKLQYYWNQCTVLWVGLYGRIPALCIRYGYCLYYNDLGPNPHLAHARAAGQRAGPGPRAPASPLEHGRRRVLARYSGQFWSVRRRCGGSTAARTTAVDRRRRSAGGGSPPGPAH
jgi:hypothetical protein